VGFHVQVPPGSPRVIYGWLTVGPDFPSVARLNRMIRQRGPQTFLDRTQGYWHLWLDGHAPDLGGLPQSTADAYETSLSIMRTQIDNQGAVLAANDSDVSSSVRDTYSYMWPRDGALVTAALVDAGYIDLPRAFFDFCARVLSPEGYLLHKYNPDGTLASSWHPWMRDGHKNVPLQEDETALVLWAFWHHFERHRDVEFIKPYYRPLIIRAADFLAGYVDPESHLPLPSYDLWEERYGVHTWTVAATWGGLDAAARFADAFGETAAAAKYRQAADAVKTATLTHLWRPKLGRFLRGLEANGGGLQEDPTPDASIAGIWKFGLLAPDDKRVAATMNALRESLWVKTDVGGCARYVDDNYHQVSQDLTTVPGNPWFICTLWLSEWYSAVARSAADLKSAAELLAWAADRALPSGVLAEQVHPFDDSPLSVSPLTWSHGEFISAVHAYLEADRRVARPA
jgi:glucoamylase